MRDPLYSHRAFLIVVSILLVSCAHHEVSYRLKPGPSGYVLLLGTGFVRQGQVKWRTGMTVRQAIAAGGGVNVFANLRKVRLVTLTDGGRRQGRSHWEDLSVKLSESKLDLRVASVDLLLSDGDVIIIDEKVVTF